MKKLLATTTVAVLGLALIGNAQAGKSGGGSSSGRSGGSSSSGKSGGSFKPSGNGDRSNHNVKDSHRETREDRHDKDMHHEFKESHHDFKSYKNQKFFYGKNNHFWSDCRWWGGYNCYVYWCPQSYCWYYWNDFYCCYSPVAVVPCLPYCW